MAVQLPPIPNNPITDVFVWRDWFYKVSQLLVQQASIAWTSIDFTGSNLQDIQTRQHNALQNIQGGIGGQYYHLTATEYASIGSLPIFGTMATQDANNVNITGGTISGTTIDNLTRLTIRNHNDLQNIQGGSSTERYHLTASQYTTLTTTNYGSFSNTADQLGTANNTAAVVALNTTDIASNMSLASNKITLTNTGKYNIQFSIQFVNTHSQDHNTWVWLRKNGTDLVGTGSKYDVPATHGSSDGYLIAVANFFVDVTAGDYIELVWAADQIKIVSPPQDGVYLEAYAASTSPFTMPSVPASVVTVSQVG